MLPTITKGYLIAKFDYDVFDEILVFLTKSGEKLSVFSSGSRKINSKNGRNTFFGNFLEIEYFVNKNKSLQKLKKITTIHYLNESINQDKKIISINTIFNKLIFSQNIKIYELYQEVLGLLLLENNYISVYVYAFFKILALQKEDIKKIHCSNDSKKQIRSFNLNTIGWECFECYDIDSIIFSDIEIELINKRISSNFFKTSGFEKKIENDIYQKVIKKLIKYKSKQGDYYEENTGHNF